MKFKNKILLEWLLFLLIIPWTLYGQYDQDIDYGVHPGEFERVGQIGWQFLKIPTSARQSGMGGVFGAVGNGDASFALSNPALIADVDNYELYASNMNWIADIKYQSCAFVKNFGNYGVFGINFLYLNYGDMIRTEYNEILIDGVRTGLIEADYDLGTFGASDMAIGLCYSRIISDRLKVGGNLRYLRMQIDDASTSNLSFDIGTIYYTGFKTFRIALIGRNFGRDVTMTEWSEQIATPPASIKMPINLTIGAAIDILEGKDGNPHLLTLAVDFLHPNDGPEKWNVGTEYSYHNFLMLRAGYRFNYDEEGLTLGAGMTVITASKIFLSMNYAYWDFGVFGSTNMISLGFGF